MPTLPDAFDAKLDAWRSQQPEPWMQLRYRIAQTNLDRHLDDGPLRILDVGGVNGAEALPLAAQGQAPATGPTWEQPEQLNALLGAFIADCLG